VVVKTYAKSDMTSKVGNSSTIATDTLLSPATQRHAKYKHSKGANIRYKVVLDAHTQKAGQSVDPFA
jgi:hypothetical protein